MSTAGQLRLDRETLSLAMYDRRDERDVPTAARPGKALASGIAETAAGRSSTPTQHRAGGSEYRPQS